MAYWAYYYYYSPYYATYCISYVAQASFPSIGTVETEEDDDGELEMGLFSVFYQSTFEVTCSVDEDYEGVSLDGFVCSGVVCYVETTSFVIVD